MSKHQRAKHEDVLSVLSDLDIVDMMDLYIEAKTGDWSVLHDNLPTKCIQQIEQLGIYLESELNKVYSEDMNGLFK